MLNYLVVKYLSRFVRRRKILNNGLTLVSHAVLQFASRKTFMEVKVTIIHLLR